MDQERNLGVTEARFALTILTCLLVAIGYIALLKLGGTKDPLADSSSDDVSPPSIAGPTEPPTKLEPPPIVLPLDKPEDGQIKRMSRRPEPPAPLHQSPESERR
jgi:hypothetical protein